MSSPRLLVVSDDLHTRREVAEAFTCRGYAVDAVPDAMQACELSEARRYHVAVLDELCGDEEGTELFQALSDIGQDLNGILCARNPNIDTVERALDAGMRHVAVKPVDPVELVSLVENLSLEAARPFEERFPHAGKGFQVEEGITKISRAMRCEWCSRPTQWADPCLGFYFCCHDCYTNFRRSQEI